MRNALYSIFERMVSTAVETRLLASTSERQQVGHRRSSGQHPLVAHVEFVLEDEFQELTVAQPTGGGFLQTHVEGLGQAGETQLSEGALELGHGVWGGLMFSVGAMR